MRTPRLAAEGKVAVYGVYFDTDKADVKVESKPALAEMAKLLQQDAKLKVYVVGHTDNQGALAHNVGLLQKRRILLGGLERRPRRPRKEPPRRASKTISKVKTTAARKRPQPSK